jgi:hypothetical protein
MATPWISSTQQQGKLSVLVGASMTGAWAGVFRHALSEFNALARRQGLGVTLVTAGSGEADVTVATASGQISVSYGGAQRSEAFDGRRLHGATLLFSRDGAIEKAFVFLPSQPQVNTPRGVRPVGANVLKVIAVHELVHACGLENSDHSTDDLFQGNPQVDPGSTAAGDKVRIEDGGRMRWMPPLILSGSTAQKLRQLWTS